MMIFNVYVLFLVDRFVSFMLGFMPSFHPVRALEEPDFLLKGRWICHVNIGPLAE